MSKFDKLKSYYPTLWNKQMIHDAVVIGWITKDEYKLITGEDYVD